MRVIQRQKTTESKAESLSEEILAEKSATLVKRDRYPDAGNLESCK